MLAVSVAGGDNQDQMTLQLLLNPIDFGLEPAESVVAPRFMTDHFISSFGQKPPALGQLRINPELGPGDARRPEDAGAQAGGPLRPAECRAVRDQPDRLGRARTESPSGTRRRRDPAVKAAGDPRAGRHAMAY